MKYLSITFLILIITSCNDLDIYPLSESSTEDWYSTVNEVEMATNALFLYKFWERDYDRGLKPRTWTDSWSDDWTSRNNVTPITGGTINGQTNFVIAWWNLPYECIANANILLTKLQNPPSDLSEQKLKYIKADARFARACQYSKLIFLYGDVPFFTSELSVEEAFQLSRTSKEIILEAIYEDLDYAIENSPIVYENSSLIRATKGAALAFKARIALLMEDWEVAKIAAKACIDLNIYELHPNFENYFLSSTKNSKETIFSSPRKAELGVFIEEGKLKQPMTRIVGGTDFISPSWELLCSFLCEDGLPIDESPLFNPQNPFENRDPRCNATIVEFQTRHLGYMYQPHPDSLTVLNFNTNEYVSNADSRGVGQFASFNGLVWKKGIDDEWLSLTAEPEDVVMRFADVLLMYAEAKIELNEIDETVLDAMNMVRARAYGVDYKDVNQYPEIRTASAEELRRILRIERRMEFAFEGRRYYDIIRWRLAEDVLNRPIYGMLDVDELRDKLIKNGLWFFPETPEIDENGVADFTNMYNDGLIKLLAIRNFDSTRQYLWPIPASEIQINQNITQNPNY